MLFEVWTITGQCLKSIRPKLVVVLCSIAPTDFSGNRATLSEQHDLSAAWCKKGILCKCSAFHATWHAVGVWTGEKKKGFLHNGEQHTCFQDAESCRTEREGHTLSERHWTGTKCEWLHLANLYGAGADLMSANRPLIPSQASSKRWPLRHQLRFSFSLQPLCSQACSWWD